MLHKYFISIFGGWCMDWAGAGSCEIINASLYVGKHIQCNTSGTLFPTMGYIGLVAQHLYNVKPLNLM